MKIFITTTPEIDGYILNEVITILNQVRGELSFHQLPSLEFDQMKKMGGRIKLYSKIEDIPVLSFQEILSLCNIPRINPNYNILDDDYVVVITNIENEMHINEPLEGNTEWFSAFDGGNIFIYGKNWESLTGKSAYYTIAYQIIENVFQSLINLDIENWNENPHIHKKPIGCINDMCDDITEVIYKLHAGYICNECFQEALRHNVSGNILLQLFQLLQEIRNEFINFEAFSKGIKPYDVTVSNKDIYIWDVKLTFNSVEETLYRFFLNHLEGVKSLYDKKEYFDELYRTYFYLKRKRHIKTIETNENFDYNKYKDVYQVVTNLCDARPGFSTFSKTKSEIKAKLKSQLGVNIYHFYCIKDFDKSGVENDKPSRTDHNYKINLPQELIKFT